MHYVSASIKRGMIRDELFWMAHNLPKIAQIQSKSSDKGQRSLYKLGHAAAYSFFDCF